MTMRTGPFIVLLTALALLAPAPGVSQTPDRSKPPALGPTPSLRLPAIQKRTLTNGLPVLIVELHEVPVAQVDLVARVGSAADPTGKEGLASLTAAMLDEGAGTRDALALADVIDFLGAELTTGSSFDAMTVRLHAPVSRLADALPLMADVALRPTFPDRDPWNKRDATRPHGR
jgi:zinc protease